MFGGRTDGRTNGRTDGQTKLLSFAKAKLKKNKPPGVRGSEYGYPQIPGKICMEIQMPGVLR